MLRSSPEYKWSTSSISLSASVVLLTALAGVYYQGQGVALAQPPPALVVFDLFAAPASLVVACIALVREVARARAVAALVLSVLALFCAFSL